MIQNLNTNSRCLHQGAVIKHWVRLSSYLAGEKWYLIFYFGFTEASNLKSALGSLCEVSLLVSSDPELRHCCSSVFMTHLQRLGENTSFVKRFNTCRSRAARAPHYAITQPVSD